MPHAPCRCLVLPHLPPQPQCKRDASELRFASFDASELWNAGFDASALRNAEFADGAVEADCQPELFVSVVSSP